MVTRASFDRVGFVYSTATTATLLLVYLGIALFDLDIFVDDPSPYVVVFVLHLFFGIGQVHDFRPNPVPVLVLNAGRIRLARWTLGILFMLVVLHFGLMLGLGRDDEVVVLWNLRTLVLAIMMAFGATLAISYGLCLHNVWPWFMRWKRPLREWRRRRERASSL